VTVCRLIWCGIFCPCLPNQAYCWFRGAPPAEIVVAGRKLKSLLDHTNVPFSLHPIASLFPDKGDVIIRQQIEAKAFASGSACHSSGPARGPFPLSRNFHAPGGVRTASLANFCSSAAFGVGA